MIEVGNLVKEYRGGQPALDGVSFSVAAGETFGLLQRHFVIMRV